MYRGNMPVTIITATGNRRKAWGDLTPLKPEEYTEAMQQVVTRYRIHLPVSSEGLTGTDQVEVDGLKYGVKGDAEPHRLRGRLHHYEAIVERTTG